MNFSKFELLMYFQLYKAANFYKIPQEIWLTLLRFTGRQEKKMHYSGAGIRFDTEEVYVSKVSCWGSAFDYILDHLTTFLNYSGIVPTWWNI